MPISGVIIRCRPERSDELFRSLAIEGAVEIHGVLPDGQIVAVIESDSVDGEVSIVSDLLKKEGVIDVLLAYHNFSDLYPENGEIH
jgi:periplasmic nitrate reductase NapD